MVARYGIGGDDVEVRAVSAKWMAVTESSGRCSEERIDLGFCSSWGFGTLRGDSKRKGWPSCYRTEPSRGL